MCLIRSNGKKQVGRRSRSGARRDESGQSTVEFALTLTLIVAFILFFFQLSMFMALSDYVQYATFMAARAYLSAGLDPGGQEARARQVIEDMLKRPSNPSMDRFPTIFRGVEGTDGTAKGLSFDGPQFKASDANYSWMRGIRYSFKGRIFLLPFGSNGVSTKSDAFSLKLISETYLGREATWQDCNQEMKKRGGGIYDNGC